MDIVTLDLSSQKPPHRNRGFWFSGFATLKVLEVKLDYRDGLVDFEYDPKRVRSTLY